MIATISRLLHRSRPPIERDGPRWLRVPAGAHCALCGRWLARGAPALWLPRSTQHFCRPCGRAYLRSSWSTPQAA
jgi:hypothetical protein